jgi:serine/threonine protein phosphatase PrpC
MAAHFTTDDTVQGRIFKCLYKQRHYNGSFFESGVSYVPNKTNEDRFCIHSETSDSVGFAIFDGHGGAYASDKCSQELLRDLYAEIGDLLELPSIKNYEGLSSTEKYDVIFCAAFDHSAYKVHQQINRYGKSGATCISACLKKLPDGNVRVYCSNIGDSRCAMAKYKNGTWEKIALSEDHNLNLSRENLRVENFIKTKVTPTYPLPGDPYRLECNRGVKDVTRVNNKLPKKLVDERQLYPDDEILSKAKAFLSLVKEERKKLAAGILPKRQPSVPLIKAQLSDDSGVKVLEVTATGKAIERGDSLDNTVHGTDIRTKSVLEQTHLDGSTHLRSGLDETEHGSLTSLSNENLDSTTHGGRRLNDTTHGPGTINSRKPEKVPVGNDEIKEDPAVDEEVEPLYKMKQVYQSSFIDFRRSEDGLTVGPKALFGRYGLSIMMSRSIGDRHIARSCVYNPEIMSVDIAPDEYCRLILASDGLWDVVDIGKAFSMAFSVADPIEASLKCAIKARQRRQAINMRLDDITCIIIDINPNHRQEALESVDPPGCDVCAYQQCTIA